MKEIPLTRGMVALVDDEDYEEVMKHAPWFAQPSKNGRTAYAVAKVGFGRRGSRTLRLHKLILGDGPEGMEIDHRNLNGLDNRRSNLRWATNGDQRANQPVRRDSTTGFKGVSLVHGRYWMAQIRAGGEKHYLGYFPTAEAAARAYDAKAREVHGDFAHLNFPMPCTD